jgi:hypothetical protein
MEIAVGRENRKHDRREIELVVHILTGEGQPMRAWLSDISESGAGLTLNQSIKLPDQFVLELSDKMRRWCRIVWRSEEAIGVQFTASGDIASQRGKRDIVVTCAKTGKTIATGIQVDAVHELRKLTRIRRFTRCPHCKVVHGWEINDARVQDGRGLDGSTWGRPCVPDRGVAPPHGKPSLHLDPA